MIQAVVPLMVRDEDDILLTDEGKSVALHVLTTLGQCLHVRRITVCGNSRDLNEIGTSSGSESVYAEAEWMASMALPSQYHPWPRFISPHCDAAYVLVVSPRNPFLTSDVLNYAIRLVLNDPDVNAITSVVASSIHPCQLFYGRPTEKANSSLFLPDQKVFAERVFFPEVPSLWRRNENGSVYNQISGKQILGRQDFPETVEPDGSFLLVKKAWARFEINEPPAPMYGFKLHAHESLLLMNRFDYMRYQAKQQAVDKKRSEILSGNEVMDA